MTALSELLWQARSGASVSIALPPTQERGSALAHEQLMRGCTFVSVTSKEALQVRGYGSQLHLADDNAIRCILGRLTPSPQCRGIRESFLKGEG